ncbi:acetylcholinesterase [Caerostris extrusa]|uniref:Acetylcholinesterase n=1 Tax=Caerostris extrusa TaxID=172846 RepID=A0AAV4MC84_CAEEX|nr:acetylcholinesterase [Caerostris extrusa]
MPTDLGFSLARYRNSRGRQSCHDKQWTCSRYYCVFRRSDGHHEAFLGIPYAEPPIGRLRFLKTYTQTPWMGVFDASTLPPTCIQNVTFHYYYEPNVDNMTEDCLHLNLWVPYSRNSTQLKPIIIFIHGGALNVGSSNMKFMMAQIFQNLGM